MNRQVIVLTVVAFLIGCVWTLHSSDDIKLPGRFSGSSLSNLREKLSSIGYDKWPFSWHGLAGRPASYGALNSTGRRTTMRENLREDKNYLISFFAGGFTNQVMEIMYTIDVARRTGRIPIVPSFEPALSQQGLNATIIPPGSVFDLSRLSSDLGFPIVQLHELKLFREQPVYWDGIYRNSSDLGHSVNGGHNGEWEDLGCWSTWERQRGHYELNPSRVARISVHYTPVPAEAVPDHTWTHLDKVIPLLNPSNPPKTSLTQEESEFIEKSELPFPLIYPENHLACVDNIFWAGENDGELRINIINNVGSWRDVGQYMRFNDDLVDLANEYVKAALGVRKQEPVPKYIAAHLRRGDYSNMHSVSVDLVAFTIHKQLEKAQTSRRHKIDHRNVIILTDEDDPEWLAGLSKYGFKVPDHSETIIKYGAWYPTLLDTVIMSKATILAGSWYSTMSVMAAGRVTAWQQGYVGWPLEYVVAYDEALGQEGGWRWPGMLE